ncbi:SGNH/GDSL hydrolase family protein [Thalassomonas actiniarum]|uniref:SGNH hydrolase-type esterase domain-containing protein n=1 Tax=Thalassomonas actiniarum TaxID=485447 RepID=A0AAF0C1W7_9GAMM|nr:SGNH/GDSL hydrolase family protein [Thalassomonas actiniarum]WDD97134.1 hypothetical protein SG35_017465 [Thalassomonas actiniarum]
MKYYLSTFLTVLLLIFGLLSCTQLPLEKTPSKIFFIGNSLTGNNYLPDVLQAFARANSKELVIGSELKNSTALIEHWQRGIARQKIIAEKWDFVVLQDSSASAIDQAEKTLKYGKLFANIAKQQNSRLLLFNTWAYNGIPGWVDSYEDEQEKAAFKAFVPQMYQETNALYAKLAQAVDGQVVPVAQAWRRLNQAAPHIALHTPDKIHPSPQGTYFTALVFYQAIFGELPKNLPLTVITRRNLKKMHETIKVEIPRSTADKMLTAITGKPL